MKARIYLAVLRLGSKIMGYAIRQLLGVEPFIERWIAAAEIVANNHILIESLEMDLDDFEKSGSHQNEINLH